MTLAGFYCAATASVSFVFKTVNLPPLGRLGSLYLETLHIFIAVTDFLVTLNHIVNSLVNNLKHDQTLEIQSYVFVWRKEI